MNLGEWEGIIRRMAALHPSSQVSAETVAAYFDELREFDADLVEHVVRSHAREQTFFPSVSELISRLEPEQDARDHQRLYSLPGDEASVLVEKTEKLRLAGVPIREALRTAGYHGDIRALPLPHERKELPA